MNNKEIPGNHYQGVIPSLDREISPNGGENDRGMNIREKIVAVSIKGLFHWKHETTPERVSKARRVVEGNNNLIQLYMDLDGVTDERLAEIREDEEQQNKYVEIMNSFGDGGRKNQESRSQLLSMPVDELCGWFEYFQKHYERRFNIELLSPEEKARCR